MYGTPGSIKWRGAVIKALSPQSLDPPKSYESEAEDPNAVTPDNAYLGRLDVLFII